MAGQRRAGHGLRRVRGGSTTRGEVEVDAGQRQGRRVRRIWLDPRVGIHPAAAAAIPGFDAIVIGPGSFHTSLVPTLLPAGVREAVAAVDGPIVLVANLLTEGRGMEGFTAATAVARIAEVIGRRVDAVIVNTGRPADETVDRYAAEDKRPLPMGRVPNDCEVVSGEFWQGTFARHARRRLAYAVWSVLSRRLLCDDSGPGSGPVRPAAEGQEELARGSGSSQGEAPPAVCRLAGPCRRARGRARRSSSCRPSAASCRVALRNRWSSTT